MSSEIDFQIKDELFKDKVIKFYNKNKIKIIILFILTISVPIILQIIFYLDEKKNKKLISEYLKAEQLIDIKASESLKIFNSLKLSKRDTIVTLSQAKILEIYLNNGDYKNAIKEINNFKYKFKDPILNDLYSIKKVIVLFDNLSENEILQLLKSNKNPYFENIKNKLLFDFYVKNNQMQKANQINKRIR